MNEIFKLTDMLISRVQTSRKEPSPAPKDKFLIGYNQGWNDAMRYVQEVKRNDK